MYRGINTGSKCEQTDENKKILLEKQRTKMIMSEESSSERLSSSAYIHSTGTLPKQPFKDKNKHFSTFLVMVER